MVDITWLDLGLIALLKSEIISQLSRTVSGATESLALSRRVFPLVRCQRSESQYGIKKTGALR